MDVKFHHKSYIGHTYSSANFSSILGKEKLILGFTYLFNVTH